MHQLFPNVTDDVDLEEAYAPPGHGRHVRANFVCSLDGSAELGGTSHELSSASDRQVFSVLRGLSDVILVGAGTVRQERYGPVRLPEERQAARFERGMARLPAIAVVTARLDLDLGSPFFTEAVTPPLIVTAARAPRPDRLRAEQVARVIVAGEDRVDLHTALEALAGDGLKGVLCEGGPTLFGELVREGLLDELCLTVSPVLAGPGHPRIIAGENGQPCRLTLGRVLTDQASLFLRYVKAS